MAPSAFNAAEASDTPPAQPAAELWISAPPDATAEPEGRRSYRSFDLPGWFERAEHPGCFRQEVAPLLGPASARPIPAEYMWPTSMRAHSSSPRLSPIASARRMLPDGVAAAPELDDPPHLSADQNVTLPLTAAPEAHVAAGLVDAVAEAKSSGLQGPRGDQIIGAAVAKLEEQRAEFKRCARERSVRFEAFERCVPMQRQLDRLYAAASHPTAVEAAPSGSAASSSTTTCGPRRADFLDLHLSLLREGFLRRPSAAAALPPGSRRQAPFCYPFCWLPPAYVLFLDGLWPLPRLADGEDEDVEDEEDEEDEDDEDEELLRPWDHGIRIWRELVTLGGVREGLLTRPALGLAMFELADGHVLHEGGFNVPFGGTVVTALQAHYAFVRRMVKAVTTDAAASVPAAAEQEGPPSPPSPRPPPLEGAKLPGATQLRHAWPSGECHLAEVMRKLGLLRAAIVAHEGMVSRATALKEWRSYSRAIGLKSNKLNFTQLDRALREMPGIDYNGLTFRYAVVAREGGGNEALLGASRLDAEETLCFLRWLDHDGDGLVSADDYSHAVLHGQREATQADLKTVLSDKWHKAALVLESLRRRQAA